MAGWIENEIEIEINLLVILNNFITVIFISIEWTEYRNYCFIAPCG